MSTISSRFSPLICSSMLHLVNTIAVATPPLAKIVFLRTILKVSDEEFFKKTKCMDERMRCNVHA